MEFALLGWPEDGPTLDLDYREFSYAGKFVMSNTGKAVARVSEGEGSEDREPDDGETEDDQSEIVGAIAFNADRTDADTCWLRYVTVREDFRGEGVGPRLAAFATARAAERGYERARIAVNNPFAYQALYRAGFRFTGEETGMAELVLERDLDGPTDEDERDADRYRAGLDVYRERDLSDDETSFLADKRGADPPSIVGAPA